MTEQTVSSTLPNGALGQRMAPKMAPTAYRSFEVHSPLTTHYRNATCGEVECAHHFEGWTSTFDLSTPDGRKWGNAVARSGRRFTTTQHGALTTFHFPAGQKCFRAPHRVPIGRPELYVVRDGDWRGNPTGLVDHVAKPVEFVERMAENLDVLDSALRRG